MRRSTRNEAGFTIVEVLVAVLILSIAAMTTFSLLSAATRNVQRAKGSQVALEYAEQELEYLRSLEDKNLAMKGAPEHSSNPLSPDYRVINGTFALQREPPGNYRRLVVNEEELYGGGKIENALVTPGPIPFASGDVKGKLYRYVVWRNDAQCPETKCPGKQDYKQIVVAVRLDAPPSQAAQRGYVEVQSNFINPRDNAESDPKPDGSGNVVTAQQFFLSDSSCSPTSAVRQPITANHLLHNTLGICANGLQTGSTPGAPDALVLGSPPDPDFEDPNNPLEYDYSNDSYLDTTPDAGTGLQILKDDTPNCHFTPTGTSHPQAQVHRWVTDPMPQAFKMLGTITLQYYTETINKVAYPGKLCVFLYKWKEGGTPFLLTNTNGGTTYWMSPETGNWPTEWLKRRLTMTFTGTQTIEKGERLGLGLSVERANTQLEALAFMYDHPKYPARLEVDTSTPLEGE
ncbi:MAG TPA: type II secretion system protein [Solirubrobacterales bacterium]|nr:type II secretion system protein [Solirubrobacterales bacterium]